jgi:uncharacterized membrane protein
MANKAKYPVRGNVQGLLVVTGSFVPNGTSDPTSYVISGGGAVTIAYSSTGTWTLTVKDNVYKILAAWAAPNDTTDAATVYHDAMATWVDSTQVVTVKHTRSSDLSTTNKALSNTCDRISFGIVAQLSSVPGDGA